MLRGGALISRDGRLHATAPHTPVSPHPRPALATRLADIHDTVAPTRGGHTPMSWTIQRHGRVAVVTMTTNPVNAQNRAFFADLHEAFDRLEARPPRLARSC